MSNLSPAPLFFGSVLEFDRFGHALPELDARARLDNQADRVNCPERAGTAAAYESRIQPALPPQPGDRTGWPFTLAGPPRRLRFLQSHLDRDPERVRRLLRSVDPPW